MAHDNRGNDADAVYNNSYKSVDNNNSDNNSNSNSVDNNSDNSSNNIDNNRGNSMDDNNMDVGDNNSDNVRVAINSYKRALTRAGRQCNRRAPPRPYLRTATRRL